MMVQILDSPFVLAAVLTVCLGILAFDWES